MSGISVKINGAPFTSWTAAEVSRDLEDFSGSFSIELRDSTRNVNTLPSASFLEFMAVVGPLPVEIFVDDQLELSGYIDKVAPDITDRHANVTITGRDKTGDLVDSSALVDGPAEFKNVKLEDAAKRIAQPFGLDVRSEIDTGEAFVRYSLDLGETAFSAIEKGARSRHALVLSDGVGGIVVTRAGKNRAPADLKLPGNVLGANGEFSYDQRHSETIVRGQGERAGKERKGDAALDAEALPIAVENREAGDGSATDKERKGTAATGRATDDEITRYRPIVHLARSKADQMSAKDEADWRMRNARAKSEQLTYSVHGFGVDGRRWRVNEMTRVEDAYMMISRDMLISKTVMRQEGDGRRTELTVTSPEAFTKGATGSKRTNAPTKTSSKAKTTAGLDGTAEGL